MAVAWQDRITGLTREDPEQLLAHPLNARIHPKPQQQALAGAIRDLGYLIPVVVNDTTGHTLDGHLRIEQAISEGQSTIPVIHVELPEELEAEALLTIDPVAAMAAYDKANMEELLRLTDTQDEALQRMLSEMAEREGLYFGEPKEAAEDPGADVDQADELRVKWGTTLGQVWTLGPHRLIVGSSTERLTLDTLMGGKRAALLWTDPPYGVEYVGKTKAALTIQNDGAEGLLGLLTAALGNADTATAESAPFYIAHPAVALCLVFGDALRALGWRLHQTLIWVKDSMVLGHSDYHFKHEPIYYGWTSGSGGVARGREDGHWHGNDSQVSVFEVARPKRSELHPTMKPPELVAHCIRNSSREGDIVLDVFLGSGSTMVAAEQTGRVCYGVELDPRFAAVTLERLTGMGVECAQVPA